jgi:hypothetical protein
MVSGLNCKGCKLPRAVPSPPSPALSEKDSSLILDVITRTLQDPEVQYAGI